MIETKLSRSLWQIRIIFIDSTLANKWSGLPTKQTMWLFLLHFLILLIHCTQLNLLNLILQNWRLHFFCRSDFIIFSLAWFLVQKTEQLTEQKACIRPNFHCGLKIHSRSNLLCELTQSGNWDACTHFVKRTDKDKQTDTLTQRTHISDRHINHVEAWTFCSYKQFFGDDISASFQIKHTLAILLLLLLLLLHDQHD